MSAIEQAVQKLLTNSEGKPLLSVDNTPQLAEIAKEELNKDVLTQSYQFAETAYDIQIGRDGIEDTQNKLKGLQGKVGECVYAIAKLAYNHCANVPGGQGLTVAAQYFKALCEMDEKFLVNKYVEDRGEQMAVSKLIPLWPVYKSSIAKGMEKGIDPMARDPATATEKNPKGALLYATAAQYRAKVQELEAKERGANERRDGNNRSDPKESKTALAVISSGWSPKMKGAMSVMVEQLNRLDHEHQDIFANDILAIGARAKTLADTLLRDAAGDTRTEAQKGAQPLSPEELAAKMIADRAAGTEENDLDEDTELDPGTKAALDAALAKEDKPEVKVEPQKGHKGTGRKGTARQA